MNRLNLSKEWAIPLFFIVLLIIIYKPIRKTFFSRLPQATINILRGKKGFRQYGQQQGGSKKVVPAFVRSLVSGLKSKDIQSYTFTPELEKEAYLYHRMIEGVFPFFPKKEAKVIVALPSQSFPKCQPLFSDSEAKIVRCP